VVGIGEIGLDYHYNLSPPSVQRDVFRRQIRVARALSLPVVVHHREAESDLLKVLEEEKVNEVRGILHSFTADRKTAESALEMGFLVSFSGILTFKNASPLREVARSLPVNRILVESDCPYLAPVPHRGKRNEPALVRETLLCLAELKGLEPEEVERATDDNFRRFFGLT
jgi:TatD DNase family protein